MLFYCLSIELQNFTKVTVGSRTFDLIP